MKYEETDSQSLQASMFVSTVHVFLDASGILGIFAPLVDTCYARIAVYLSMVQTNSTAKSVK